MFKNSEVKDLFVIIIKLVRKNIINIRIVILNCTLFTIMIGLFVDNVEKFYNNVNIREKH